ncbi:MAG: acyl-ACP--UDP-N-acetylglucosamine O-acyltransferase [Candidatus Abyssobacteria bacterium SURF_17]|uniref:Acyl-[acyl-carrier-protein]--UDP-N-acetylglucosamine O-acyltransferase n=1 Tax=Candidatus Abyssobacteria bacterium SURF_17 TaxID=2093361 RepID=A0A419F7Y1_9BACT|nr:MAG: acyl-ACP--UDP-N-acetylglucosamine O-acyltransferase [Candidatus Abyssubacteria bacterium SURF_17]
MEYQEGEKDASQQYQIHPTAVVHKSAQIAADVEVGPYTFIGPHAIIGNGCSVGPRVVIDGHTTIGENNRFFTGAVVGSPPQDLKYRGGVSRLVIGDNNTIREYVTINTATSEKNETRIGNGNLLMAYVHVAHECDVHNGVIMANSVALAGHVTIDDKAIIGGLTGVHQFVTVGTMAIVGGCSKVVKDILPYSMADGNPTACHGANFIGLKRNGIPEDARANIKKAFKIICRSNLNTSQALERLRAEFDSCAEIDHLIEFIEKSSRGVCS